MANDDKSSPVGMGPTVTTAGARRALERFAADFDAEADRRACSPPERCDPVISICLARANRAAANSIRSAISAPPAQPMTESHRLHSCAAHGCPPQDEPPPTSLYEFATTGGKLERPATAQPVREQGECQREVLKRLFAEARTLLDDLRASTAQQPPAVLPVETQPEDLCDHGVPMNADCERCAIYSSVIVPQPSPTAGPGATGTPAQRGCLDCIQDGNAVCRCNPPATKERCSTPAAPPPSTGEPAGTLMCLGPCMNRVCQKRCTEPVRHVGGCLCVEHGVPAAAPPRKTPGELGADLAHRFLASGRMLRASGVDADTVGHVQSYLTLAHMVAALIAADRGGR